MRLIGCHVENFGVLQDLTVTFEDGLNSFCRENGWGKSTLMAFLRVMFYGFEGETKRKNVLEQERLRYRPWQGGVYGGQVTFSVQGKEYVASRIFGERPTQDQFSLRRADTNQLCEDFSEHLGEELFGINSEAFARTVFIAQQDLEVRVNDSIQAKLGDLTEQTGDLGDYERADAALADQLNRLSPNRKTGALYRQREALQEVRCQVENGRNLQQEIGEQKKKIQILRAETTQVLDQEQDRRTARAALERNRLSREQQIRYEELSARFRDGGLDRREPEYRPENESPSQNRRRCELPVLILVLAGIVLAVLGWMQYDKSADRRSVVLMAVGLILVVIGLMRRRLRGSTGEDAVSDGEDEIRRDDPDRWQQEVIEYRYLCELKAREEQAKRDYEIAAAGVTTDDAPQECVSFEDAHGRIRREERRLEELCADYDRWRESCENLPEMERQLKKATEAYENLSLTREYLQRAREALVLRYRTPVLQHFSEYYEYVTDESAKDFHMDTNLHLTVDRFGMQRDAVFFSSGYRDLMGFCLRIALIDEMYRDEKPFLLLDDPFVNLDERKRQKADRLLHHLTETYQILYFSCQ